MKKLLLCLLMLCSVACAETIEVIVTTSAGGPTDNFTRKIVQELENKSNLKFVVMNKVGASHNIGYSYIHSSDKPTLFIATNVIITNKTNPAYPQGITFSVEPLFFLGEFSNILLVNSKTNIKSFDDLIKLSKDHEIRFGHGGIGTYGYEALASLCETISCISVPYKSGSDAIVGLLSESIDVFSSVSFGADIFTENNRLRPILIMSNQKHDKYEVPTLPKKFKDKEIKNWVMLFGRNLSNEDKTSILNILKKEDKKFYTDFGVWYEYKNPNVVWKNSLKE